MADGIRVIDLHGKTAAQARVTINAAIRKSLGAYRLRLVHGYNTGTALRDMIWDEYTGANGVLRLVKINDGTTDLVLREF